MGAAFYEKNQISRCGVSGVLTPNKIQGVAGAAFSGIDGALYKELGARGRLPQGAERERQLRWRLRFQPRQLREALE